MFQLENGSATATMLVYLRGVFLFNHASLFAVQAISSGRGDDGFPIAVVLAIIRVEYFRIFRGRFDLVIRFVQSGKEGGSSTGEEIVR